MTATARLPTGLRTRRPHFSHPPRPVPPPRPSWQHGPPPSSSRSPPPHPPPRPSSPIFPHYSDLPQSHSKSSTSLNAPTTVSFAFSVLALCRSAAWRRALSPSSSAATATLSAFSLLLCCWFGLRLRPPPRPAPAQLRGREGERVLSRPGCAQSRARPPPRRMSPTVSRAVVRAAVQCALSPRGLVLRTSSRSSSIATPRPTVLSRTTPRRVPLRTPPCVVHRTESNSPGLCLFTPSDNSKSRPKGRNYRYQPKS